MENNKLKSKIAYISPDSFFDVDFPILKELNKGYNLVWHPIIPTKNSRYTKEEIELFCEKNKIEYHLHIRKGRRRHVRQLFFSLRLLRSVKKNNPDIIYTEYLNDIYLGILAVLFLPKKRTIYAVHDVTSHTNFKSNIANKLTEFLRNNFTNFHLFSQTQKTVFDESYKNKKTFYAPLALKDFGVATKERPEKKVCKFLFFGSILEYKGLDLLINAAEALIFEGETNFVITIAGKGSFWKKCESLIKNKAFFKTQIKFIADEEIPNLFNTNHFLVLPYLDVTQSGPQMIALNYGLPIIASEHDGFKEYTENDQTGFLFENNSIDALKQTIKKAIALSQNEYDNILNNIKHEKKYKYQMDNIIGCYDSMFKTVLNESSKDSN